jgi:hypothetical protein
MKKDKRQYIIRKYIMASSAKDAIRIEKKSEVDDVWLDQDWEKERRKDMSPAIGFVHEVEDDDD